MAQVVENRVQLGCGSLILIALIVLFFSNHRGDRDHLSRVTERLDRIERRLDAIEKKIDTFIVKS